MSHLTTEALARLVDEPATEREQAHLASCAVCRATLGELRMQTVALGALPSHSPPDAAWNGIAERLRDDHLRRFRVRDNLVRIAAAIGLIAIGATAHAAFSDRGASNPTSEAGTAFAPEALTAELISLRAPKTIDEASSRLRAAETMYTRALLDYAAITSPRPPQDAVARLATLEAIVLTTRAALERAPADPLINTYHLAAQAERESLLDQLRRTPEAGRWY